MLKLDYWELQGINANTDVMAKDVFEAMEFGAYSATLIPAIVESLVLDGYVRKVSNCIEFTQEGEEECNRIEERKRLEYQETLRKLGYQ